MAPFSLEFDAEAPLSPAPAREERRMIPLTVHHRTAYRHGRSVDLWPHWLMLCSRESRDVQVISCVVTVSPTAEVT
jgi:Bacterial transglutaminase-like N-terminal region